MFILIVKGCGVFHLYFFKVLFQILLCVSCFVGKNMPVGGASGLKGTMLTLVESWMGYRGGNIQLISSELETIASPPLTICFKLELFSVRDILHSVFAFLDNS